MEDEQKHLPFFALPDRAMQLCELAGIPQVSRVCNPHLVLYCSPMGGSEEAGRAANEAITLGAGDAGGPAMFATIAALRAVPDWRRTLMTHYSCLDENGDGGFLARLHYPDGTPHPAVLHWASEEHYLRASMYMTLPALHASASMIPPAEEKQFRFARQFSLTSGSLVSTAPGAARTLALTGVCRLRPPGCPWVETHRPEGVEANPDFYDEANIREVTWRAKVARYTQHAPSARALLATGRALLTAQTVWCPQVLEIGTMAVRTLLQTHPGLVAQNGGQGGAPPGATPAPAEHVANQVPHPLALTDGLAAVPGAGPR